MIKTPLNIPMYSYPTFSSTPQTVPMYSYPTFTSNPIKITNQSSFFSKEIQEKNLLNILKKVDNKELTELITLLLSENKQDTETSIKIQKQYDKVTKNLTDIEKEEFSNKLIKTSCNLKKLPENKLETIKNALKSDKPGMNFIVGIVLLLMASDPGMQMLGTVLMILSFGLSDGGPF